MVWQDQDLRFASIAGNLEKLCSRFLLISKMKNGKISFDSSVYIDSKMRITNPKMSGFCLVFPGARGSLQRHPFHLPPNHRVHTVKRSISSLQASLNIAQDHDRCDKTFHSMKPVLCRIRGIYTHPPHTPSSLNSSTPPALLLLPSTPLILQSCSYTHAPNSKLPSTSSLHHLTSDQV